MLASTVLCSVPVDRALRLRRTDAYVDGRGR